MSAGVVFQQMCIIFLLVVTGYLTYKKGIISDETSRGISALVVNVCNPALLVNSAFDREPSVTNEKLLLVVLGGAIMYVLLLLAAWILPGILHVEKKWRNHYSLMCVFGNTGFIGLPLTAAVLGNKALIYVAISNVYFALLFYTIGIRLADDGAKFNWKELINMGNLSTILTLLIFLLQPKLPAVITQTVGHMANSTTLLAMMIIGVSLAKSNLKSVFGNPKMYLFCALRYVMVPFLISMVLKPVIHDHTVFGVLVLLSSVPAGSLPLMRVEEKGGDGRVLSTGIILSTLLSLITIPLVVLFV